MDYNNGSVPIRETSSILLRWTEDPPRKEGFFWYTEPDFDLLEVVRVYAGTEPDSLRASGQLIARRPLETMDGKWAGPIPSPPG